MANLAVNKKPTIEWGDFEKVDIRIGTIVEVSDFEGIKVPAYKLQIDFGPLGVLKSSAQLPVNYSKEELTGKQVAAVMNFQPKQIASFMSEVLVLGFPDDTGSAVLFHPTKNVSNGGSMF